MRVKNTYLLKLKKISFLFIKKNKLLIGRQNNNRCNKKNIYCKRISNNIILNVIIAENINGITR